MRLGASLVSFLVKTSLWGPKIEGKYMNIKLQHSVKPFLPAEIKICMGWKITAGTPIGGLCIAHLYKLQTLIKTNDVHHFDTAHQHQCECI